MTSSRIDQLAHRVRRLRRAGELRKATLACETLVALEPEKARWWVHLGVLNHRLGRSEEARKSLRQAIYLFRQYGDQTRRNVVESYLRTMEDSLDSRVHFGRSPRHGNHAWRQARVG